MLKGEILNGHLLNVLANTGHMDWLLVSDAGMPVPVEKERVELALTRGIPGSLDVVRLICNAMAIEKAFMAEEVKTVSPNYHAKLIAILKETGCEIVYLPHAEFKKMTQDKNTRACIRTAEYTSYSSLILQAGVTYSGESK